MTGRVIQLDDRRDPSDEMDVGGRHIENTVNAAVDNFACAGAPLVEEAIVDQVMTEMGDGPDAGPDVVRWGARQFVGGLVRAAIARASLTC